MESHARRKIQLLREVTMPGRIKESAEICGAPIPYEVDWASFADDMLEQLNQVILRQQQRIDSLERQMLELRQRVPEDGGAAFRGLRDELPPHY